MSDLPVIDAQAALWSHPESERAGKPLLVLLHGYGADEHDLFGLVPHLPEGLVVTAVPAPLSPPWPMPGRSWYAIDHRTLNEEPPSEGDGRDPSAITDAARALLAWLDDVAAPETPVVLFGFSQGAAVSLQALRLAPDRFGAVVALSGYAARGELPGDETLRETRPPVFWGRGSHDEVIPPHHIDHTAQWLPDHSTLSGRVYPGMAHNISPEELADIHVFLTKWQESDAAS